MKRVIYILTAALMCTQAALAQDSQIEATWASIAAKVNLNRTAFVGGIRPTKQDLPGSNLPPPSQVSDAGATIFAAPDPPQEPIEVLPLGENWQATPLGQQLEPPFPADTRTYVRDKICRHCGAPTTGTFDLATSVGGWVCPNCLCDVSGQPVTGFAQAYRLGFWGVDTEGSPTKVGEFQELRSSAFADFDGILSDGTRTLDYTLSAFDREAANARANYYAGPEFATRFNYNQYLRRLDHKPLNGFDLDTGAPGPTDKVVSEDLNVGEDYAIRVQQLDARFQGRLTSNLKWRLNLWGIRKDGERQANAVAHCYNLNPPATPANYTCHELSQKQIIDWRTIEVTPVVEARLGRSVVEYSRTMRGFGQDDQIVGRTYTAFGFSPAFGIQGPVYDYAWVPETFTQIDRVKVNIPIGDRRSIYSNLYVGDTENKFRGSRRGFYGCDVRLSEQLTTNFTLTTYAKLTAQNNEEPTNVFTSPPFGTSLGNPASREPASLQPLIDYNNARAGFRSNWKSFGARWLSLAAGYEYGELSRDFADYNTLSGPFTQPDTRTHLLYIGPQFRITPSLDAYVRYKAGFANDPLIGVRSSDGRFNTNQPEQDHRVEFGSTWAAQPNLLFSGMIGIENSWNRSAYANFDEDNYPILFTVWYAPVPRLTLTGGYAFLSNWIDQDITIGFRNLPTETTPWNYDGYSNLFSINASYASSARTRWIAGAEWNRGYNVFSVPPSPAGANWTALPTFSDVIVETTRLNVGFDEQLGPASELYFRYVFVDYDDRSAGLDSGQANMFLAGLSWLR